MAMLAQDGFPQPPFEGADLMAAFGGAASGADQDGFQGAIANLTLADVIQLEGRNQFSGSILVAYQEQEGKLFFQGGEVVHAEVGTYSGEDAFRRILEWPGGSFHLQPNVTSLHQSIQKRLDHLILSAHQWMDETRHTRDLESAVERRAAPRPQAPAAPAGLTQVLQGLPGIAYAVLMDRNGTAQAGAGSHGEALAARGIYLAGQLAGPLGQALQLGDLQVVAMQGGRERVMLFRSRETYLAVELGSGIAPEEAEAAIRQALLRKAGR